MAEGEGAARKDRTNMRGGAVSGAVCALGSTYTPKSVKEMCRSKVVGLLARTCRHPATCMFAIKCAVRRSKGGPSGSGL